MTDDNLDLEKLLSLVDVAKPVIYHYILCHPSVEGRIREMARRVDIAAEKADMFSMYAGLEIVSHPNMLVEHCLAIGTLEELNKVLGYLDTPERIEL